MEYTKPEMCSVIVPMHETVGRYGGLMLSLVASAMISEMEDRFTDGLKLLSLSRGWTKRLREISGLRVDHIYIYILMFIICMSFLNDSAFSPGT